jgi:hypothetical protein
MKMSPNGMKFNLKKRAKLTLKRLKTLSHSIKFKFSPVFSPPIVLIMSKRSLLKTSLLLNLSNLMDPSSCICKNSKKSRILHSINNIRIRGYYNFQKLNSCHSKILISTSSSKYQMAFNINKTSNMSRKS